MRWKLAASLVMLAVAVARGDDTAVPAIETFANVTAGQYQVLAQSGATIGWQVNRFMNVMLKQYAQFFANWTLKDGARVVVFDNRDDFRAYSKHGTGLTHGGLAGYCHLKTDEDGNTFFELVTYEQEDMWQVLAHEGFHQFLGYELGLEIPVWLNEGLAQYFETSTVAQGKLRTGQINKRQLYSAQLLLRAHMAPALPDLLQLDRASFYANAKATYPTSWALVYYLLNRNGETYRSSTFRRYLQDLKMNRDSIRSFQHRFGSMSEPWAQDFERYILQLRPTPPS